MKFVFRELQDLLNDFSLFGDLDNLCVNSKVSDRFKPFIPGMDDLFLESLALTGTEGPVSNFQVMR
jgi:hypothetical protein